MKTTRREFLHAAAAPAVSRSSSACRTRPDRRRRSSAPAPTPTRPIHDWGSCRPDIKWGNTHGVVEDSQGNIYVHHTVHATSDSADTMVVFDRNGKFVRSWGKEFRGVAHGLQIRKEGATSSST